MFGRLKKNRRKLCRQVKKERKMAERDGSKDEDKGDRIGVEESKKEKRGRPRKEDKQEEASTQIRNFLESGSCGFTINFGERNKLQHSPIRQGGMDISNSREKYGKENEYFEDEGNGKKARDAEGYSGDEEEEKKLEEVADSTQGERVTEVPTLPTKTTGSEGEETGDEKVREERLEGDTGREEDEIADCSDKVEKDIARLGKLVKNLEVRLDRSITEREKTDKELINLNERLINERLERLKREGEIRDMKKWAEENRTRIETLERELREALELRSFRVDCVRENEEADTRVEGDTCEINNNFEKRTGERERDNCHNAEIEGNE